ncbi:MAG: DM13 domain-containing protein [Bacteroidota bacterium]|nr:DM13 domain-containing protein [Bacteroidota bacterium]
MNKIISVVLVTGIFLLSSCSKTPERITEDLPTGTTTLLTGSFTSNAHTTSGTVKVVTDASGKKFLVFENFRTDNGPNLFVWLSPTTSGSPYQELGNLKAINGNFSYELDASINYTTNNRVLIWCKPFSVLFGHAILQ